MKMMLCERYQVFREIIRVDYLGEKVREDRNEAGGQ
jgi:hypothetical protein